LWRILTMGQYPPFLGLFLTFFMQHIRIGITWLWLSCVLISTVGVNLQTVYCFCLGERYVAWLETPDTHCAHGSNEDSAACTFPETESDCCSKQLSAHEAPLAGKCAHTTTHHYYLKSDFQAPQLLQWSFDYHFWVDAVPVSFLPFVFSRLEITSLQPFFDPSHFAHPPPSGWALCILHGIIRC
jgi:hypothetical protein